MPKPAWEPPEPDAPPTPEKPHALKQFAKFCIVGGTSTAVDFTIFTLVLNKLLLPMPAEYFGLGFGAVVGAAVRAGLASIAGTSVGVVNSYVWNSLWTFRGQGTAGAERFMRFVVVNIVGLLLSAGLTAAGSFLLHLAGHDVIAPMGVGGPRLTAEQVAKLAAIVIVVFWNFFANRRWTYA